MTDEVGSQMNNGSRSSAWVTDSKPVTWKKGVAFYFAMLIIILVTVEVMSQIFFFAKYGRFVWSGVDHFSVRSFTQIVDDGRYVTMKPIFDDPSYEGWRLSTDSWRFRRGTHKTDPNCASILFLGASVPFGWGVPDNASLPSKFFNRLKKSGDKRCVINAAIPSYSLFQAVERYRREIHGKMKIDVVFLQVYDPVSQLLLLGPRWQREANWTTMPALESKNLISIARFSAAAAIVRIALQGFAGGLESSAIEIFSPDDHVTLDRFRREVRMELERLHRIVADDGGRELILASLAVPTGSRKAPWFSDARRLAIEVQNEEFRRLAAKYPDTVYADTADILGKISDSQVFIDGCCHLSERGNDIVSEYVMRLLFSRAERVE